MEVFRHYWIYFVILERNFDTYRVLGANIDDRQIVFADGNIADVLNCEYDVSKITDVPLDDVSAAGAEPRPSMLRCAGWCTPGTGCRRRS